MTWTHTHRPRDTVQLVGHAQALERIRTYLAGFKPGTRALMLTGDAGIGKTCMVHALAAELDCELIEVNASDTRNKDGIHAIVGQAAQQRSLFFRPKVILVDELEGISGNQDRGGVGALCEIVASSTHPIILITSDATIDKLKPLRKICEVLVLTPPSTAEIVGLLARIAHAEQLTVAHDDLQTIARRSGGDVRAAVNDLQGLGMGGSIEELKELDDRQREQAVETALVRVFKSTDASVARGAFDGTNEEPDVLLWWLDQNLPAEYTTPRDLAAGFDALAEADRYLGRVRRWQYYRYYAYIFDLLTAGVALAKDKRTPGTHTYERSTRGLQIWMRKQKFLKRDALAERLAPALHTSVRRMKRDVLPLLKAACRDKATRERIIAQYHLGEEAAWL